MHITGVWLYVPETEYKTTKICELLSFAQSWDSHLDKSLFIGKQYKK